LRFSPHQSFGANLVPQEANRPLNLVGDGEHPTTHPTTKEAREVSRALGNLDRNAGALVSLFRNSHALDGGPVIGNSANFGI